jgi:hypothetical protein
MLLPDVVVLACDIDRGIKGVVWARQAFPGIPVLYVAGNASRESYRDDAGAAPANPVALGWPISGRCRSGRQSTLQRK